MALSDMAARNARPKAKPFKLYDEDGLYLFISPAGGKYWRVKYRWQSAEKTLSVGSYPEITLKEARERRDDARVLLAHGVDPYQERKRLEKAKILEKSSTLRVVAAEFIEKKRKDGFSNKTLYKMEWFFSLVEKDLGDQALNDLMPYEILQAIRKVEENGHYETANRIRGFLSRVFRYGVLTGRAATNPAAELGEALIKPKVRHHAAIVDPSAFGQLLRDIDAYNGFIGTRLALKLAPHVFVRPGELRSAEWKDMDRDNCVWKIPAERMKMREPHSVPLSRQSLAILNQAHLRFGNYTLVFPARKSWRKPMSDVTLNKALRTMGYSNEEMVSHGFRSTASTLLNESRLWAPETIELALSHVDDSVRGIYQRSQFWDERVEMAQWWSDYLDHLKAGVDIQTPKQFAQKKKAATRPTEATGSYSSNVTMTVRFPGQSYG
ncbi:tyrosine-type recombinase/integrase [Asticcacaulis taihuensis]|uniref:Integrase n=1 Tax=Asticcacaulis taihuensis TaxID=260084 RepID=A0A1G4SA28_9CAUL|nr:integrase arm-type DNA-binding domain-containing protein [Asticcacaulis taihuensis]SCW65807.1 Integrase [Asticcacaulis taihuensis]